MRPKISWSDLAGRRIGIYGLGREGEANLRAALARGIEPVLVDDNPVTAELAGLPVLKTSNGGLAALQRCEVVVKAPGISRYSDNVSLLQHRGVEIVGGLGLWLEGVDRERVICVTGTKGKSTTSVILGHLLRGLGHDSLVCGNIGILPYDPVVAQTVEYWVVEVSSYQATDFASSPPLVAVTALHQDHLPWHSNDYNTYIRDKLSIATQAGACLTVANGDEPLLRAHRDLLGPSVVWVSENDEPNEHWPDQLGLPGKHNRRNALIAAEILRSAGIDGANDSERLGSAAAGFESLPSRLKVVGHVGDVCFVDDSLSTNVLPMIAALETFHDRRVALIVGGQSRGIDYRPLGPAIDGAPKDVFLLTVPDNGPDIRAQALAGSRDGAFDAADTTDLFEAVRLAHEWAKPDGVVLLSPGAPSFGIFRDYEERGAVFASAMEQCR